MYPETAIVSISTHGNILEDTSKFKFEENIPDSKVIIVSTSAPGVCNYASVVDTTSKDDLIMEEFESFDMTKGIEEFVFHVVPMLKEYDVYNTFKYRIRHKNKDQDEKNYTNLFNRGHNIQIQRNGNKIFNKMYSINKEENEQRQHFAEMNKTELSVQILNMPNFRRGFDLLDLSPPTLNFNGEKMITLRHIIEHLNKNGCKNIIIFDSTCNLYSNEYSERSLRQRRRFHERDSNRILLNSTKKRRRTNSNVKSRSVSPTSTRKKRSSVKTNSSYRTKRRTKKNLSAIIE